MSNIKNKKSEHELKAVKKTAQKKIVKSPLPERHSHMQPHHILAAGAQKDSLPRAAREGTHIKKSVIKQEKPAILELKEKASMAGTSYKKRGRPKKEKENAAPAPVKKDIPVISPAPIPVRQVPAAKPKEQKPVALAAPAAKEIDSASQGRVMPVYPVRKYPAASRRVIPYSTNTGPNTPREFSNGIYKKEPHPPVRKESYPPVRKEPVVIPSVLEEPPKEKKVIEVDIPVALKDLANSIQQKPAFLIKKLLLEQKMIINLNHPLDEELAGKIAAEYGYQIKRKPTEEEVLFKEHASIDPAKLKKRPPIVTFMGHVDHGKTSLLDMIRKTKVAEKEYGGITQHIGAYAVKLPKGNITFLDTPGHEAFTAMRARGAKATDIVVLVVAADDGIMPQTIEAIDHAKDAKVPIIVAMNKIDKPQVDIDRLKRQLSEYDLSAEDWGGKTITVGVSAKTGEGIDELLEMILLEAEMLELKADPLKLAKGVVLDAKISEGKGPVVTLLVEEGTLRQQDVVIVGAHCGKVRAMFNEFSKSVVEAGPSQPVEVLGLQGLPDAGDQFFAVDDEKKAKEIAAKRKATLREKALRPIKIMSLEDLSAQIKEGKVKELKLILKADVSGSLEAINEAFKKLQTSEVILRIIHKAIGSINLSDVVLAEASGAIIIGFHVTSDDRSKAEAESSGVDIRTYNVIYELFNDLKTALEGMLEPKIKKSFMGRVIIRQVFKLTRSGIVAGCYVEKGKITRSSKISIVRNGEVVFQGALQSLKRFKDDVREVAETMECGITLAEFKDIMVGDIIEAYSEEKIARKLD